MRRRALLLQAAADQWKVAPTECSVAKGEVTHTASGRKAGFGALAQAAAALTPPAEVKLKAPADWQFIGKRCRRSAWIRLKAALLLRLKKA